MPRPASRKSSPSKAALDFEATLWSAAEIKGIAVLDERAVRREAKILKLRFTGTIGLLYQGLQRKWLTEAECLARVAKLCDAGFAIPRPAAAQSFADYFAALE